MISSPPTPANCLQSLDLLQPHQLKKASYLMDPFPTLCIGMSKSQVLALKHEGDPLVLDGVLLFAEQVESLWVLNRLAVLLQERCSD